jgi:two-component system copper resistance phosphate regulon response regulator CusR
VIRSRIGSRGWSWGPTIIWSSRLLSPNCSPACAPCCAGGAAREPERLALADLELDVLKRRATRAGKRIDLTAKEFALLELFLRRQGEVLSRSFIASQVWDMNFDSDTNVVEVAIRRLRAKVDDDFTPRLIHTLRGMGYVMEIR